MTWRVVKIGSLCAPVDMGDPRRRPEKSFRYIDISGIDRELKRIATTTEILGADAPSRARQIVRVYDVLVSTVRPNLNAVAMVPPELDGEVASTGFCILRAIECVLEPRFLFYFTRTEQFITTLLQHVRGANYPAVTDRNVLDVGIPWPARSEQRRIVEILDQADRLRQLRRAADEKAQRIIPALFYKMFGDPLRNPRGWPTARLGDPDMAEINPRPPANNLADDSEVSFLPMADVDEVWGRIVGHQTRTYAQAKTGFTPFQEDDVLFAKITPCMQNGKSAIARRLRNGRGYGSTEFHVLRAGPRTTAEWLFALVRLPVFREQAARSFMGTAGQQRVPADFLKAYTVPVPPMALQTAFARAVRGVLSHADIADERRSQAERIFRIFLHRAFTGELTPKWREAHREQLEAELREQLAALERARTERPRRGRGRPAPPESGAGDSERHAGHDMFNKAALVTYIVQRCHDPRRPHALGRTKLAKLFYLVQRRAEVALTEQFARRAAGPLDDTIHKFLNLAKKNGWLDLPPAEGKLKPVIPGRDPQPAIDHVRQRWSAVLPAIDQMLETMKGWGWEALERWATVLHVAENLLAEGKALTPATVKAAIAACPEWRAKLDRAAFSDAEIQSTLAGLRRYGFLPGQSAAKH